MKEDSNNIHGYRSDHKLKVHRIPTNTPQIRVSSNISPRDQCIENQKERRSHLAIAYGPLVLWWTTHASLERHQ